MMSINYGTTSIPPALTLWGLCWIYPTFRSRVGGKEENKEGKIKEAKEKTASDGLSNLKNRLRNKNSARLSIKFVKLRFTATCVL